MVNYAKIIVLKYEIDIHKGNDTENIQKIYLEDIYDTHIAYGLHDNIGQLFPRNTEPFHVRARAILNNTINCQYSNWMEFVFKSDTIKSIGIISRTEHIYNAKIREFWNEHKDINNDTIQLTKWISIFEEHERVNLNESELKRIYFYLCSKDGPEEGVKFDSFFEFARDDVYRGIHHKNFVCYEWMNFRRRINAIKYSGKQELTGNSHSIMDDDYNDTAISNKWFNI